MPNVTVKNINLSIKVNKSTSQKYICILAHGAGAGMDHPFMEQVAKSLSAKNGTVIRFNFPYMEEGRKSPGSPKRNIASFDTVFTFVKQQYPDLPVFIAGKSYGGRMASHWALAHQNEIKGLVYLGFPLHAAGKPSKERASHLLQLSLPQLFIQGTRDALADYKLISEVIHSLPNATAFTLRHANHSFHIPGKYTAQSPFEIFESFCSKINNWAEGNY